jgi:alpha-ketoglutarate-dependent taurine dioxygenase
MLHHYLSGAADVILPRGTDGPMRTLYGTVWSTISSGQEQGSSVADSAYGQEALPLHTDMTYFRDPPGLQIFTMLQPALRGGESLFCDGFAVAERVRSADPEAFSVLATTPRRFRSIDTETGWHLEASGPVIALYNDQVVSIRHNDLDRLPDLPCSHQSPQDHVEFYEKLRVAHQVWDSVLSSDDIRLEMRLRNGDTMIVANQVRRCMHLAS